MTPGSAHEPRDYAGLLRRHGLEAARPPTLAPDTPEFDDALRRAIDILWLGLSPTGISWIGFYKKAAGEEMTLVCREPGPACSPIGLQGACGRCWRDRRTLVVRDVADLGANYIACDFRDRSEVVIPILLADESCWGVLDADSHEVGSFDGQDAAGMERLLVALGISRDTRDSALRRGDSKGRPT